MHKYFAFIALLLILSCTESNKKVSDFSNYHYLAQNQNNEIDRQADQLIRPYLALVKGLQTSDTLYLYQNANYLLKVADSLLNTKNNFDQHVEKLWMDGVNNLYAELQGLQFSIGLNDMEETKTSFHMCSIQLLNLLTQIGYKQHTIYIFNTLNPQSEDGYIWLGLQKEMRDPFYPQHRNEVSAVAVLQELK